MVINANGVLTRWTYRYPFDQQSQAALVPVSTLMGDRRNDKYAGTAFTKYLYNSSTIILRFFYDYSPRAFPCFYARDPIVSRSKENPSPNLACTKFFYIFSTKLPWSLCFLSRVNSQQEIIVEKL
jgi:hypothetical protein